MPWTCEQTEDRLLDAFEGTLGAAAKAELDAHLAACGVCSGLAASVRMTIERLRQLGPAEPAPGLITKILAQTMVPKPAGRRRFAWLGQAWQPRFALGAMAVVVTFSIVMHAASSGASGSLAAMNPVQVYREIDRRAHLVYAHGVKFFSDLRVVYEIQSRFQPQTESTPASAPQKRSSERSERVLFARLEDPLLRGRSSAASVNFLFDTRWPRVQRTQGAKPFPIRAVHGAEAAAGVPGFPAGGAGADGERAPGATPRSENGNSTSLDHHRGTPA